MEQALEQVKQYFFNLVPEMDEEKWKSFAEVITIKHYSKGDTIIKPGDVCNHVSFVNYGLLRSYFVIDDKDAIYSFFWENTYFSDYESFISRRPAVMYSDVLEDTELAEITYDNLQKLYHLHPECERAGRLVAESLFVILSNRNAAFLLKTPEQRYYQFMEDCSMIATRVPQYMIASYLGITPEALSRIRARFRQKVG